MKIALCTSEAVPFAKTGGLADVCGALPLELENLGHEVVLVMPKYPSVRASGAFLKKLDNDFDWMPLGETSRAYFLKHDMFLRGGLYGDRFGDYPDNLRRFAYFCQKSCALFQKMEPVPDVVHVHDWQTALIPALLRSRGKTLFGAQKRIPKTLLTIHNISYQGLFPGEMMPLTGLEESYFSFSGFEFYGKINLLKGGILYADLINTVSLTYGAQTQTKEFGCGLEGVLAGRRERYFGIINGVDYKVWNPQGDPYLARNYSLKSLEDKKSNKRKLQETCGLVASEETPLLGFVGRLVEQKGIDLIVALVPEMCRRGLQVVILGTGDPHYEEELFLLKKKYPQQLYFSSAFDDKLAHQIYAASDMFLMPSKFEPCGMGQLISFKYGTVPVVFRTGGLADTVVDYKLHKTAGTGFVFDKYNADELMLAIRKAQELYCDKKKWQELMKRIMKLNFSWKESARRYVELYEKSRQLKES